MGRQIIKQPNGKYCIFSSVVDGVIWTQATRDQLVEAFVDDARKGIEREVDCVVSALEVGGRPYYQFTMTYAEMLETIFTAHDSVAVERTRKECEEEEEQS